MKRMLRPVTVLALAIAASSLVACGDSTTSPLITSKYTVTALMADSTFAVAGLNNAGQVVGRATIGGKAENVLITHGVTRDLGSCWPTGINMNGAVSCSGGAVWRDGQVTPVIFPGAFVGSPAGVNDNGVTAGIGSYPFIPDSTTCYTHNCAYIASSTRVIVIAGSTDGSLLQVPRVDNGTDVVVFSLSNQSASAAVWQVDSTSQPYPCAGLVANSSFRAVGGDHEVVGVAVLGSDPTNTDAIVCRNGVMQSLGSATSEANDISESGLIVGNTDDGHGFVWDNGKLTVLDAGLAGAGWRVVSADRVNDAGQIVVTATDATGDKESLLLTPV